MSDLEVRVVSLDPMTVASTLGFGPNPEESAWNALGRWAETNGLLEDLGACRFYGFNNPSPSPGSPNYGYEQWMVVAADVQPGDGVQIKDFPGGLYAVTRCQLKDITEVWGQLAVWCENSPYTLAQHQWLEECLTPELLIPDMDARAAEAVFDLYLPIAE